MNQKRETKNTQDINNALETPKPGLYRHYKGGEYKVIATATHSESGERQVVYQCLRDGNSWWVRPLDMFMETVEIDGECVPRFEFQSE
jgi:hypothetical protein